MRSTPSHHRTRRERAPARRLVPVPRRRPNSTPRVLRGIGAAVLVAGWIGAAVVLDQPEATPDADAVEYQIVKGHVFPLTLAQSRRTQMIVQRMNGDMGLWFAEFDVELRSLLRPPRLAWTLLVVSTVVGAVCLHLAKLSDEDVDD